MAMRSRVMLATSIRPVSTTLSRSTPCSCTSRSVVTCSSWRARSTRSDFDGDRALAVLLGHFDLAHAVLLADLDLLPRASMRACSERSRCSSCTLRGLGLLARRMVSISRFCLRFGLGQLAFQRQDRLARLDVLAS